MPREKKPGVMFHSCNPNIWGREVGVPAQVQSQLSLCSALTSVAGSSQLCLCTHLANSVNRHCLPLAPTMHVNMVTTTQLKTSGSTSSFSKALSYSLEDAA